MGTTALPETCCRTATLWLGTGYAAYLGASLRLDAHSGSVQCLAVGLDAPFTLRIAELGERTVRSALIPPRRVHRVLAHGDRMLFCYFDPGSPRARGTLARMVSIEQGIGFAHDAESELIALAESADPDPLQILDCAGGRVSAPIDARIVEAIATLRANPSSTVDATELAAAVHLSTSRFLHLFSAHAGTSFRRYRLWVRMVHVGAAVSKGRDLTTASADAGFASPSHFSDAFHTMCGLTATDLLASGARIVLLDS